MATSAVASNGSSNASTSITSTVSGGSIARANRSSSRGARRKKQQGGGAASAAETKRPVPRDLCFKFVVIGDHATGKTSLIKRYVHQFFSSHYRATIGVDFATKNITWDESTNIRLQFWDLAGQDRFGALSRGYYHNAVGALIVFDITEKRTFENVLMWKEDLDSKVMLLDEQPIPSLLLANKCDLTSDQFSDDELEAFCKERFFFDWFKTSAKENIGLDDAIKCLLTRVMENERRFQTHQDNDIVSLDGPPLNITNTSRNCCS